MSVLSDPATETQGKGNSWDAFSVWIERLDFKEIKISSKNKEESEVWNQKLQSENRGKWNTTKKAGY